jgi:SAM-dependent methyltransferase
MIELKGNYDTIFCLEVIEHLMNPLRLLEQINRILEPDGKVFLSTPKHKPHFLWDKYHFTELDEYRFNALVTRAGFESVRIRFFRTMPIWWYFTGFRPFLRMFFNKGRIAELKTNKFTHLTKLEEQIGTFGRDYFITACRLSKS